MGGGGDDHAAQRPHRVLYGRRTGRPLSRARRALLDRLLPRLDIDLPAGDCDPAALFSVSPREVWLEIGFGGGEHLAAQARANPAVGLIGCEPFIDGIARLLAEIDAGGLGNIRLFRDDARLLLDRLANGCIARAFILFPDPWPKLRHHKRRIVAPGPLRALARVLRPGAELRVATDDPGYKEWILYHVLADGAFEWTARGPADWRVRPADWPATRYEAKAAAAGRTPAFFTFRRRAETGPDSHHVPQKA